ncbi:hypothetical protein AAC387_Pa09g2439 [Persea americana]
MALFSSPCSRSSTLSHHTNTHFHMNSTGPNCKTAFCLFNSSQKPFAIPLNASSSFSYSTPFSISKRHDVGPTSYGRRRSTCLAIRGEAKAANDNVEEKATETTPSPHFSWKRASHFIDTMWRFQRPHTSRGTILASLALAGRAWIESPHLMSWKLLPKGLLGLVALICANAYIVGINQIFDVQIDKINKPYLPIASGELSTEMAWILVLCYASTGLLIVFALQSEPLIFSLYCLALLLGTLYSVPPFRLKRYPAATVSMIAAVRGFFVNFGVYHSVRAAFGLTFEWSPAIAFITVFVTIVGLVVAILKDLSDVEGDQKNNITTLATRLGVRNMGLVGTGFMLTNYVGAILLAIYMPRAFRSSLMIPAHIILGLALIFEARKLERAKYSKEAVSSFYQYIWNLFYAEYIIFPFI